MHPFRVKMHAEIFLWLFSESASLCDRLAWSTTLEQPPTASVFQRLFAVALLQLERRQCRRERARL